MAVRRKGVFYIVYIITTCSLSEEYYNANYVTYRGKGSKENTEDFWHKKLGFTCVDSTGNHYIYQSMGCKKLTYQNFSFLEIVHSEKRVFREKKCVNPYRYVYQIKDHLENIRLSYAGNNPILLNDSDGRDIGFSWETDKDGNITGINITITGKIKDDTSKGMSAKKLEKLRKRLVEGLTNSIKSDDKNFNVNVTANIGTAEKESDFAFTDHAYRIVDDVNAAVGNPKKANTRALGQAGIGDNWVYLNKDFDNRTVAHETVHSAGLPHINAERENGKFGKPTDILGKNSKGTTLYKRFNNNYHKQNLMHQGGARNKNNEQVGGKKLKRWQFNKMVNSVKSINSGKQKI